MDRGEPLPPPFDDQRRAFDRMLSDDQVPHTLVTSPDGRHDNYLQQAMAFTAVFSANEPDPLRAALDALWPAAICFGRPRLQELFIEARQAFAALSDVPVEPIRQDDDQRIPIITMSAVYRPGSDT
jgi:hypothetical protein